MVKFALLALSPLVSCTHPVIVYLAPASRTVFSGIEGPPLPLELVVVSRLYDPT
jgi:hypothetical protein